MPPAGVGVYHLASMLAAVPAQLAGSLAGSLLVPLFTRPDAAGGRAAMRTAAVWLAGATAAALTVGGLGPSAVSALYDGRYGGAAELLPALAAGAWCQMMQAFFGAALLAGADGPRGTAACNAVKLVVLPAAVATGFAAGGAVGLAWGAAAAEAARLAAVLLMLRGRPAPDPTAPPIPASV